ncbi:MAG TPA: CBM35 domain-containing protein, partial [Chthonomonadales bacterium]|nr:CBM35 domain-containing protein [Chthonomonadales bacterium]
MLGTLLLITTLAFQQPKAGGIRLEAENGNLKGVTLATAIPGYSGSGYVTGFKTAADTVTVTAHAKAGLYRAVIGYSAPNGRKGFQLSVNGVAIEGMFAATGNRFARSDAGLIYLN